MARRKKAEDVVDGFTTLQAAQRAAAKGVRAGKKAQPQEKEVAPHVESKPAAPAVDKARIGHTAQPTRHEIVCYECGYAFLLTGQLKSTYCPKCRSILDATEQTIDGEWNGTLKTIGVVRVTQTGVIRDGRILANDLILEGRIDGGKIEVFGKLEMCPGGHFVPESIVAASLVIRPGTSLVIDKDMTLKSLQVMGELKARIRATGIVEIRAGGYFQGDLVSHHMIVEDGGALNATVAVTPQDAVSGKRSSLATDNLTADVHRRNAA